MSKSSGICLRNLHPHFKHTQRQPDSHFKWLTSSKGQLSSSESCLVTLFLSNKKVGFRSLSIHFALILFGDNAKYTFILLSQFFALMLMKNAFDFFNGRILLCQCFQ